MAWNCPHASCRHPVLSSQEWVCHFQPHPTGPYTLFIPFPMRQANTVMTILGFTSTRSSGRAYTLAPIFRAIEMAYLEGRKEGKWATSMKGTPQNHSYNCSTYHILYRTPSWHSWSHSLGILPFLWANFGLIKLLPPSDLLSSLPNLLFVLRDFPSSWHFWCLHCECSLGLYSSRKSHGIEQVCVQGRFCRRCFNYRNISTRKKRGNAPAILLLFYPLFHSNPCPYIHAFVTIILE